MQAKYTFVFSILLHSPCPTVTVSKASSNVLIMWRVARSERRRNDDFTGVKRYSIPVGIRVKVVVANAEQFGQQFVITIQTWGTLIFWYPNYSENTDPNREDLQFCLLWDCGVERRVFSQGSVSCC